MTNDRSVWAVSESDYPRGGTFAEQVAFLLRYAILAPSSHNTQPWKFRITPEGCELHADPDRWLRVADADRRELYLSVGCALENLLIAAAYFGFAASVDYPDSEGQPVRVMLRRAADVPRDRQLFAALTSRHTNRGRYQDRMPPPDDLGLLEDSSAADAKVMFISDPAVKYATDELMVHADAVQFADPAWRAELGQWIGAGAFGQSWLVARLARLAVTHLNLARSTARRDHEALMSAPLIGVICASEASTRARIRAGRAAERLWLTASHRALAMHPMNQILQVPELQADFVRLLRLPGWQPQLVFRLGLAAPEPSRSPRRPVSEVLIA